MVSKIQPLSITAHTLTSALGVGVEANWQALKNGETGLKPCDFPGVTNLNTWIGEVPSASKQVLSDGLQEFSCRNNFLADLALRQDEFEKHVIDTIAKYGAHRVGVYIGTSTSGIQQTELAYAETAGSGELDSGLLPEWYDYQHTHNMFSPTDFVCQKFGLLGPAHTISTACSSSAKVFATAQRAIASGLIDAAVVGGVDSLCFTTLYGFNSLQVVSNDICRPSDANRSGISIGEAAGFAILEKENAAESSEFSLLGFGESADAYHMSSPHPEGLGAAMSMRAAMERAGVSSSDVSYINLHGTATPANDKSEGIAVDSVFGRELPCSSTKGWTGHTLGAAGIVEAVFSMLAIKHQWVPQSLNTDTVDPEIAIDIVRASRNIDVNFVLSNSFGFGGSNCSLLLGGVS